MTSGNRRFRQRCSIFRWLLAAWPTYPREWRFDGVDLAGLRSIIHVLEAAPNGRHHEQRCFVRASEHTGETAAVEVDCLQHFAAFADTDAALIRHVAVPDGSFGVDAD